MNKYFVFLFLVFQLSLNGQVNPKIKAVNNYIDFTNDCIHGVTIAHLMLQSFNNEVNAYVDATEGFVFKNSDFGRDVFSEMSYYEHRGISPTKFFPKLSVEGKVLGADANELNRITSEIFTISKKLNELRFETGDFIEKNDIKNKANLKLVYKKLEKGVDYFNQIYQLRNQLEKKINQLSLPGSTDENHAVYKDLRDSYSATTNFLKDIRKKKTLNIKQLLYVQQQSLSPLNDIKIDRVKVQSIIKNTNKAHGKALAFQGDGSVPKNYVRYGKFYYYYNNIITSTINTVGSGISFTTNRLLDDNNFPFVHFLDMPPLFKVLYPKKLQAPDVIVSSDDNVETLPEILKDRKVQADDKKILFSDDILKIELFDHMLLDGDKVSINFNGDWILENQSLEEKPVKLKLKLNREGKNFVLLHAVDEGVVPQITFGFSYFDNGKKKTELHESNLNTSKLIEIVLTN